MKAIEALNKVWDTLHSCEVQIGEWEEIREAKRTIEKALMIIDTKGMIHKETEL